MVRRFYQARGGADNASLARLTVKPAPKSTTALRLVLFLAGGGLSFNRGHAAEDHIQMTHPTTPMNGDFGISIDQVSPDDLADPDFQSWAHGLWLEHGGLLAVRGDRLADERVVAYDKFA